MFTEAFDRDEFVHYRAVFGAGIFPEAMRVLCKLQREAVYATLQKSYNSKLSAEENYENLVPHLQALQSIQQMEDFLAYATRTRQKVSDSVTRF